MLQGTYQWWANQTVRFCNYDSQLMFSHHIYMCLLDCFTLNWLQVISTPKLKRKLLNSKYGWKVRGWNVQGLKIHDWKFPFSFGVEMSYNLAEWIKKINIATMIFSFFFFHFHASTGLFHWSKNIYVFNLFTNMQWINSIKENICRTYWGYAVVLGRMYWKMHIDTFFTVKKFTW